MEGTLWERVTMTLHLIIISTNVPLSPHSHSHSTLFSIYLHSLHIFQLLFCLSPLNTKTIATESMIGFVNKKNGHPWQNLHINNTHSLIWKIINEKAETWAPISKSK